MNVEAFVQKMPSSKLVASTVAVFIVFVLCVAYIIGGVLGTPLTSRARNVKVELTSTGGLFVGSSVTYRGVKIGKITDIHFTQTGIEANARLTSSDSVPVSSRAQVRSLSPVGEQYLDFQPASLKGPYLQDGTKIAAQYVDLPRTLASTVISVNKLLNQIDPAEVHTVLNESSAALQGTAGDLSRLTTQGRLLVDQLNASFPAIHRVLVNGGTLLDIGAQNSARLIRTAHNLRLTAAFLKSYNPTIQKLLKQGPGQTKVLQQLIADARATLPTLLSVGGDVLATVAAYDPHLRALLQVFAPGLSVLGKATSNGIINLAAIGQADHICKYGTAERAPRTTTRRPMVTTGRCSGSVSFLQRGGAHAPGPVR